MQRLTLLFLAMLVHAAAICPRDAHAADVRRPNVVWILNDDQSRHYGCYGEPLVNTPTVDRLAAEGVKFTKATTTAPVCSPARSALITGMYQTSIGAHHHRSGRGKERIPLPAGVKMIPELFQEAGYYTSLGSIGHVKAEGQKKEGGFGKSDYNFDWDPSVYDGNEWSGRKPDQPFFAQIMFGGGKARDQARASKDIPHVRADDITLPPYYPRHPVILEDWAAYLDTFTLMDRQTAAVLERLKSEGVLDNTIIFFWTDHGVSHARGKQFCYDEGIMIPLIVWAPGRVEAGTLRDDLVSHIDIAASSLEFAGIPIPANMQGRPLFGPQAQPRESVVTARDRCDETCDRIRSVRTQEFKYIRNGYPERPRLQPNNYKDGKEILQALREWREMGKLSPTQELLLFSPKRAPEELYDLAADPWELNNVAGKPEYQAQLSELRNTLDRWIAETGDRGQQVEPMSMYDSDMAVYRKEKTAKKGSERASTLEKNIALMKQWWAEGK